MTNQNVGVYDFIINIIEAREEETTLDGAAPLGPEAYATYNFMIVCNGNPRKSKYSSDARVIYVQLTDTKTKQVTYVMPDELADLALAWIKLMDNRPRKLGVRKTDFTVLGNTTEKEFSGTKFFDHCYGVLRGANIKAVKAIKTKYEIHDVVEYKGVEQTIVVPDERASPSEPASVAAAEGGP